MNRYEEARKLIDNAKDIIVLTGEGMSAESGVKDYKSQYGYIHTNNNLAYHPSEILSNTFFFNKTNLFYDYVKNYLDTDGILPNEGHRLLVELEKEKNITLLTQNTDSLHQKAGSENIIELQGNTKNTHCTQCSKEKTLDEVFEDGYECECGGIYKSDMVLYGENLPNIKDAFKRAEKADLLIILGNAIMLQPVASIPVAYGYGKKPIIIVNKTRTFLTGVDKVIEFNEEVGETLRKIMKED